MCQTCSHSGLWAGSHTALVVHLQETPGDSCRLALASERTCEVVTSGGGAGSFLPNCSAGVATPLEGGIHPGLLRRCPPDSGQAALRNSQKDPFQGSQVSRTAHTLFALIGANDLCLPGLGD